MSSLIELWFWQPASLTHHTIVISPSLPAHYEDLVQTDTRVQYLWEALTSFTNGELTRYISAVSQYVCCGGLDNLMQTNQPQC